MQKMSEWLSKPLSSIKDTFCVCPYLLSCWICLLSAVPTEKRKALVHTDPDALWEPVVSHYRAAGRSADENYAFPPGPRALADFVASQSQ